MSFSDLKAGNLQYAARQWRIVDFFPYMIPGWLVDRITVANSYPISIPLQLTTTGALNIPAMSSLTLCPGGTYREEVRADGRPVDLPPGDPYGSFILIEFWVPLSAYSLVFVPPLVL